jgi:hypothetical protein
MVRGKRNPIDESAFDVIDPEKAYLLGFLWADGSLMKVPRYTDYRLFLGSIDVEILERLRRVMKVDTKFHRVVRTYLGPKWHDFFRFDMNAGKLGYKLEAIGFARLKPDRTPPIGLPQELVRDFIRGVFDADGYVAKNGNGQACISGHNPMLLWIQKYLDGRIRRASNGAKCVVLWVQSRKDVVDWYNYLYYPGCICLERKRLRFIEIEDRYFQ